MAHSTSNQDLQNHFKQLPKFELHRHLEGSIRLSTFIDLANTHIASPASSPDSSPHLLNQSHSPHYAHSPNPCIDPIACMKRQYCVLKPVQTLGECLQKFTSIQPLLHNEQTLQRITFEVCEDAYLDGIRGIELRYCPSYVRGNHKEMSFEKIHQAILKGVHDAQQKYHMAVGLIGIVDRCSPFEYAEKQANFIIDNKDTFVGIDLANDESLHPCSVFAPLFQRARQAGLGVTVHSGETPGDDAAERVNQAVDLLCAQRIGHGIHIVQDKKLMKKMKDQDIHFEVSPTSNILTGCAPSPHPITEMVQSGLNVGVNTDDPGLFLSPLSNEYTICVTKYSLTEEKVRELNRAAYHASFLPASVKAAYFPESL